MQTQEMGLIVPSDVPRRRFPFGDRFWSQGSYTCRQAVRERYVGPRAHRPYVTYPTIKNRQATMLTWNLCVRPACWILSNQRKPRAWRDKKPLALTRDNHIGLCNMRLDNRENSFKLYESRTLLTLKISKHTTNRLIIQSDLISF